MFKSNVLKFSVFFKFIFLNIFIIFFCGMLFIFSPPQEIAYGLMEWMLTILILCLTTIYYQKYNNEILLKLVQIRSKSKTLLKLNLFFILISIGILFISLFLLWIYLICLIFPNIPNFNGDHSQSINWSRFNFSLYYYYAFLELFILIAFSYFLNHFIKKSNYIFGLILIIAIYLFFFGNIFLSVLDMKLSEGSYYFYFRSNSFRMEAFVNSFILPWNSSGMFARELFYTTNIIEPINWFKLANISEGKSFSDIYQSLNFMPYIFLGIYLLCPLIHNIFLKV